MEEGLEFKPLSLEDLEDNLWTCILCFCGLCERECPLFEEIGIASSAPRGLSQIALNVLNGGDEVTEIPEKIIYGCTGCRWCEYDCSMNTIPYIQEKGNRTTRVSGGTLTEVLRGMLVEKGNLHPEVRDALENVSRRGNPYGGGKREKDEWTSKMGKESIKDGRLLYVGATVPYEHRSTDSAEAVIRIFDKAGLDYGMVGSEEMSSGTFARSMGEEGLFAEMKNHLTKLFKDKGIKEVITLSPHDLDAFIEYYDLSGIEFKHYLEVLSELIEEGKIDLSRQVNKKVTYHDPCYLGRKQDIFDEPRKILEKIPGLDFIEIFTRNKERSFCCGGGGTGLWLDLEEVNMDLTRADQISETKSDSVTVACPICKQMLDDAMKTRDYNINVIDVAEIVLESLEI